MLIGAKIYDKNFKLKKIIKLKQNCEAHGNYFCPNDERLYVAQPGRDSIGIYNIKTNSVSEIFISDKWKKNKKDNHHINDIYVDKFSIFVSMFSYSGNWMNDIYDGSIIDDGRIKICQHKIFFAIKVLHCNQRPLHNLILQGP